MVLWSMHGWANTSLMGVLHIFHQIPDKHNIEYDVEFVTVMSFFGDIVFLKCTGFETRVEVTCHESMMQFIAFKLIP